MARAMAIIVQGSAALVTGVAVTTIIAAACACQRSDTGAYRANDPVAWKNPRTVGGWQWWSTGRLVGGRTGVLLALRYWPEYPVHLGRIVESTPLPHEAFQAPLTRDLRMVRTAGLPLECLWGGLDCDLGADCGTFSSAPVPSPTVVSAVYIGRVLDSQDPRGVGGYLPVGIIWPGFALNTLFYAAIAWGLWQAPLAIRRRGRRRKNRCVKCGYDRAGLAREIACPECGDSV